MPKGLSAAQVESYGRDGFLFPVRLMSVDDTTALATRMEQAQAAGVLRGAARTKLYLRFPWVCELATKPALLDVVEDLIGPDIMLYHNTVWSKAGGDGAYVSWHQDNTYFGHVPCDVLTVWVAITAGEASIHHAFLIHGSAPNRSRGLRMGMTLIYHSPALKQIGKARTSALLVRGEDRHGNFEHEKPPGAEDDPASLARFEHAAGLYRAKVRELGNMTIGRFD